jgi:hypothetical protein
MNLFGRVGSLKVVGAAADEDPEEAHCPPPSRIEFR